MEIISIFKTDKARVLAKDNEGHFNIAIDFFCYRCNLWKCEHTKELIEKLSIKA